MSLVLSNKGKGMQSSSEQPLVGEERYVTTRITAAKETTGWETNQFYLAGWEISCVSCWEKGTDNVFPATLKNT